MRAVRETNDFRFNPLKRFPRNLPCFCGSNKKAKSCCMPKLSLHVYPEDEAKIRSIWEGLLAGTEILQFKIGPRPPREAQVKADQEATHA